MLAEVTPALEPLSPTSPHAIASLNIDELKALDRSLLHLFVTGPRDGEGLALALPGTGWVLIDSCQVSEGAWCIAFDDVGRVAGRWRGENALEVIDNPTRFEHVHTDSSL